jgi:hypothetical protein
MKKVFVSTLAAASLIAGAALAATTATSPAPQTAPAPNAAPATHPGMMEHRPALKPSDRTEARLAYMKTALKITDSQLPQWNAFADVARKQATERDQQMQQMRERFEQRRNEPRPNAIERLERTQQFLTTAAARTNELLSVSKPLYAALTPEQKAVADELLTARGRGMFERHGMRGMHGRA